MQVGSAPGRGQEEDSGKLWAYKFRPVEAAGLRPLCYQSVLCEVQTGIYRGPVCVGSVWGFSVGISVQDFTWGFRLGSALWGALCRSLVWKLWWAWSGLGSLGSWFEFSLGLRVGCSGQEFQLAWFGESRVQAPEFSLGSRKWGSQSGEPGFSGGSDLEVLSGALPGDLSLEG